MNQAIGLSTHGLARSSVWGVFAFGLLLSIYFVLLTLISGWSATASQFAEAWYFILALAAGFGIQVALFVRLRQVVSSARQVASWAEKFDASRWRFGSSANTPASNAAYALQSNRLSSDTGTVALCLAQPFPFQAYIEASFLTAPNRSIAKLT